MHERQAAPLALIVGAGVDQAIADRPGWVELLKQLARPNLLSKDIKALVRVASTWPLESAEALRLSLGPKPFSAGLQEILGTPAISADSPLAESLSKLINAGVNLVVSLNYTDDLMTALQPRCPQKAFRLIDRRELGAWPFGRLLSPEMEHVHIIKLHGSLTASVDTAAGIVLDRSSYDDVMFLEAPYRQILQRIFEDFIVLSVGISWTDVPLRDAAAQAKQRMPVARRTHFAVRQHGPSEASDWWEERALTSSFGLRPLFYREHSEVPDLLDAITSRANNRRVPSPKVSFKALAKWLDRAGDFESRQQSSWFATNWERVADKLEAVCDDPQLTRDKWVNAVRIERHLRHFVWFWLEPNAARHRRRQVWASLARGWSNLTGKEQESLWQPDRIIRALEYDRDAREGDRAIFDFAVGACEIYGKTAQEGEAGRWLERLSNIRANSRAGRRAEVAMRVFVRQEHPNEKLISKARAARWESIEAKVALDRAQHKVAHVNSTQPEGYRLRDLPSMERQSLWQTCNWVRELARVSGSNRREVGAIVLASLFAPPGRAQSDLVAVYRESSDRNGGKIEPTAAWSIVIGLIAAFVDEAGGAPDDDRLVNHLTRWLQTKCGEIPVSDGVADVVHRNYAPHWSQFHGRAAELAPKVADRLSGWAEA